MAIKKYHSRSRNNSWRLHPSRTQWSAFYRKGCYKLCCSVCDSNLLQQAESNLEFGANYTHIIKTSPHGEVGTALGNIDNQTTFLHACGFNPGWMAKFSKFSKLKWPINFFPQLSKTQINYQMVDELYADATIFALFMYSDVLLHFLYFENGPFYTVNVTFFIKVVWVRNFQGINFRAEYLSNP